jgi:hypothetical protein
MSSGHLNQLPAFHPAAAAFTLWARREGWAFAHLIGNTLLRGKIGLKLKVARRRTDRDG